jgi:hypothetical protein
MTVTIGQRLLHLKSRSGRSLSEIAAVMGFRGPSSLQRYFAAEYDPEYLDPKFVMRLLNALEGEGSPPITRQDIIELGSPLSVEVEIAATDRLPYVDAKNQGIPSRAPGYVEIFSGPQLTWSMTGSGGLIEIDAMRVIFRSPVDAIPIGIRPNMQHISGIRMSSSMMSPRYEIGEDVFYGRGLAQDNQDVLAVLTDFTAEESGSAIVAVGKLRHTAEWDQFEFEQLRYGKPVTLNRNMFKLVYPILSAHDLIKEAS